MIKFLHLLAAGKDSENQDLMGAIAKRLRTGYFSIYKAHQRHLLREKSEMTVPLWAKVSDIEGIGPVGDWSIEEWMKTDVPVVRSQASLIARAIEYHQSLEIAGRGRGEWRTRRKELNRAMSLLGLEVDTISWALTGESVRSGG